MNKTTICWKLLSYSKLEKLNSSLNGHLVAIKSFLLQKRSKNSLKCFRSQILDLSETKTTGNQCTMECTGNTSASWPLNQQRYHLLSQKRESSTAYSTRISKVQVLNDQALFLCWPRMDQGGLHCVTKCIIVWWLLLLYSQFPVIKKR